MLSQTPNLTLNLMLSHIEGHLNQFGEKDQVSTHVKLETEPEVSVNPKDLNTMNEINGMQLKTYTIELPHPLVKPMKDTHLNHYY